MSLEGLRVSEQMRLSGQRYPTSKADDTSGGLNMSYQDRLRRYQALKDEMRALEAQLERDQKTMRPLTVEDEQRMTGWQAEADSVFQLYNRRAPAPNPGERPGQFRRRLLDGLRGCSATWRDKALDSLPDDAIDKIVWPQVLSEARAFGESNESVPPGEVRMVERMDGGHKITEFKGSRHFVTEFAQRPRKAIFRSRAEYAEMSRDAQLHRLAERGVRPL